MFIFTGISLLLFALYAALIAWYRKAWTEIPVFSPGALQHPARTTITVLVPARNEEKNITACLDSLSSQTYSKDGYQVIVIDDHSTDGTAAIVNGRIASAPAHHNDLIPASPGSHIPPAGVAAPFSVRLLRMADHPQANRQGIPIKAPKKFAIETGIGIAAGELIVTTDADCTFHPEWLATLAAFYETSGAKFIAAPVRIGGERGSSSFLSIFQTLDFITLQGITGAAVYKKFHSMCNGANLAYPRSAFLEVDGFRDIDDIPSGDDMFLMHKIYKKYPQQVFFCKSRQAIVSTRPETHWKGFVHQRVRWASKADRYDDKRIFRVLLLVYGINLLFAILLAAAFWNNWYLVVLLALLVLKTLVEIPFVGSVSRFFGQGRLMAYFPLLQPFHIVYTIVIGWMGKFGSYQWKERKITK